MHNKQRKKFKKLAKDRLPAKLTFEYEWTAIRVTFFLNTEQHSDQAILEFCTEAKSTNEIMKFAGMHHKTYFRSKVLKPLLQSGLLELSIPEKPKSPKQKYRAVTQKEV